MKPYYEQSGITIYHGDCREVLPQLACAEVGAVFFDPPYGLGIAEWDADLSCTEVVPTLLGSLRSGGSLYATCSAHILPVMLTVIQPDRIIAWGKPNLPFRKGLNDWEWSTEFVLRRVAGDAPQPFNKPSGDKARDYWVIPVESGFLNRDQLTHPARKPVALLSRILAASTARGDLVLDPTMGSGTTLVAASRLGLRAVGIERDEKHCESAAIRLSQEPLPLEMGA